MPEDLAVERRERLEGIELERKLPGHAVERMCKLAELVIARDLDRSLQAAATQLACRVDELLDWPEDASDLHHAEQRREKHGERGDAGEQFPDPRNGRLPDLAWLQGHERPFGAIETRLEKELPASDIEAGNAVGGILVLVGCQAG